ncbi:MAG: phage tail tube protein, partial [Halobacteriales archaeon]|nr:phage tail tube protein [Halobacteriales archaeon]
MAAISGTGARVQYTTSTGGTLAEVGDMTQWSMNVDAGLIDTNAFGSTWRTAIAGLRGATASIQGFWSVQDTTQQTNLQTNILNGTKSKIGLITDNANGNGYTGECWLSGLQIQAQVDGAVGFSFDVTFDGAVSYS